MNFQQNFTGSDAAARRTLWVGDLKSWIDDNYFQMMFAEVMHQV
jgi:hypothetical protein